MRKRVFVALVALIAATLAGATARAEPAGDDAQPMGGQSEDERVTERERMRAEYAEVREARAAALREARIATAGTDGELVPGWRGPGGGATPAPAAPPPEEGEAEATGPRPIEGTPRYLLYGAIGLLGVVIVVRIRQRK